MRRLTLICLMILSLASVVAAQNYEMLEITSGAVVGLTSTTCQLAPGQETGLWLQILDASVYWTGHASNAEPSATLGALAPANTIIQLDRASRFRAIAVGDTARAYALCVSK